MSTNGSSSTLAPPPPPPPTVPPVLGDMDQFFASKDPIHDRLRSLRLDELVTLAQSSLAIHTVEEDESFPRSLLTPLFRYIEYLYSTWYNVFETTLMNEIPFVDLFWTFAFAAITSVILFFALIWCQFANNPFIIRVYNQWSGTYAHGLGLVNAANPNLFNALTKPQIRAAKDALSLAEDDSVNNSKQRVFDLDIAKLLLQLASIVYEREYGAIHQTLEATYKHAPGKTKDSSKPKHESASASAARRSRRNGGGTTNGHHRQGTPTASALHTPMDTSVSKPGELVKDLYDVTTVAIIESAFKKSRDNAGEGVIEEFCNRFELDYEPVSELNNSSSAFCSFFWDSKSNWIVVTFKGTGITEYADWVTDLTTSLVDVDDFLPGYGKVIKGFKDRIYPTNVSDLGETRPWDTIRFALRTLADQLARERNDGKDINVWFTGHSLGCALATLAYARAISQPDDFSGSPICIRDAYLFAAPVSGNRESAEAFNNVMNRGDKLKTMWRVTNADDAVATLLPQLGDRPDLHLSPTNPAGFAHLGAELKMRDYPSASEVTGNLFSNDTVVEIRSAFTRDQVLKAREKVLRSFGEKQREALGIWAEKIPFIGRFIAHDTVLYWDQLDRIALGPVRWLTGA